MRFQGRGVICYWTLVHAGTRQGGVGRGAYFIRPELFVGYLTSQLHASVSQGRICLAKLHVLPY